MFWLPSFLNFRIYFSYSLVTITRRCMYLINTVIFTFARAILNISHQVLIPIFTTRDIIRLDLASLMYSVENILYPIVLCSTRYLIQICDELVDERSYLTSITLMINTRRDLKVPMSERAIVIARLDTVQKTGIYPQGRREFSSGKLIDI